MEAEEVLLLIMKKLKEYKSNPKKSAFHEKARQKNLMKMFCIYTTLKKKERAKQKLNERVNIVKVSTTPQETNQSFDEIVETDEPLNHSNDDLVQCTEPSIVIEESNDIITHESETFLDNNTKNRYETDSNNIESEHEFVIDIRQSNEYNDESIETVISSVTASTSNPSIDNSRINYQKNKVSDECMIEYNEENIASIDGFLAKLGKRLKKLPYNQRSKLEIEFLSRLYEVEDCLGLLDD